MGNCMIKESSILWGGEDWATSDEKTRNIEDLCHQSTDFTTEKTSLVGVSSSSPKAAGTKVKIRISKKQLEDHLKDPDFQGLSAQQVLARLTDSGDRRPSTPALQSIPE
ncbi:hypothetical protein F511_10103 [Dorcoceras hygrometricum]|uniref:Uncharacterized protein n=1 Tax=Dorcoceras hygrometricum TaxID=472368 RepID=A0A2Z7A5G6_9LAMI|nr:hypothetical protein F511_10103 [Dorcoceras hygrometricum]